MPSWSKLFQPSASLPRSTRAKSIHVELHLNIARRRRNLSRPLGVFPCLSPPSCNHIAFGDDVIDPDG